MREPNITNLPENQSTENSHLEAHLPEVDGHYAQIHPCRIVQISDYQSEHLLFYDEIIVFICYELLYGHKQL